MTEEEELPAQLNQMPKGKISIAEALKQLQLAKSAFSRASRIDQKLNLQEQSLSEFRNQLEQMMPTTVFQLKIEQVYAFVEKTLKAKFDDFLNSIHNQLNQKLTTAELEEIIKVKVNWGPFNNLQQQVATLKQRIDKHITYDFNGFKKQMKTELAHKANQADDMHADLMNNQEIIQLKQRMGGLEQQLKQMMNAGGDDMLEDDDDQQYDSQEELDNINMIDDLERTVMRDKKKDQEGPGQMPALSVVKPAQIKQEQEKSEEKPVQEEKSEQLLTAAATNSNPSIPAIPQSSPQSPRVQTSTEQSPEPDLLRDQSQVSRQKGKGDAGSRAAKSRVGSRASSMGQSMVGAVGGNAITQVNKKIVMIKKDMENYRKEMDDTRDLITENQKSIQDSNSMIAQLRQKIKELEQTNAKMEMSFIKALRRRGMEKSMESKKKKPETTQKTVPSVELEKIMGSLQDKHKRLVSVESVIESLLKDTKFLRTMQKDKMNQVVQSLHYLNEARLHTSKQHGNLKIFAEKLEEFAKGKISQLQKDLEELKGPISSLVSDQHRQNQILTEDIKRQQNLFRNLVEDYMNTLDYQRQVYTALPHQRSQSLDGAQKVFQYCQDSNRINTASPVVSLKQRFVGNFSSRMSPTKTDLNWVSSMPKGQALVLPRVDRRDRLRTALSPTTFDAKQLGSGQKK